MGWRGAAWVLQELGTGYPPMKERIRTSALVALALAILMLAGGCVLSAEGRPGRACQTDQDCPWLYGCFESPGSTARVCQALSASGAVTPPDGGTGQQVCYSDVRPVFQTYCFPCHSTTGTNQDFYLDH